MRRQWVRAVGCAALVLLPACARAMGGAAAPESPPSTGMAVSEAAPARASFFGGDGDREESRTAAKDEATGSGPPPAPPPPPPATSPTPAGQPPVSKPGASAGEVAAVRGPLLVYTAQITLAVFEVNNSLNAVEGLGKDLGGFMARRDDASITIRVPVSRFDEAVKKIEKIGDMLHRNVVAEDVTEEFRDLEVQLKGARAVQERLTQLLAKATKVEESIAIEKELDRVTSEIDRIEGRMKFLKDRAAYSTITVTFQPKASENLTQTPFRLPGKWLYELGLGRLLSL